MLLGLLFIVMALCIDSLYALLAGTIGRWLKQRAAFSKAQRYTTGGVYIALGVAAAFTDTNRK